jgi:hypothetical protein
LKVLRTRIGTTYRDPDGAGDVGATLAAVAVEPFALDECC